MITNHNLKFPLADADLSRRIERTEAKTNADFVETRARVFPATGAAWIERAGAYAMFDGVTSPLTQTFGLGLFEEPGDEDLRTIEEFFRDHGAEILHEVSPLASRGTFDLLRSRNYEPLEFTSVLFQPIGEDLGTDPAPGTNVSVRVAEKSEAESWAKTASDGWGATPELADFLREIGTITASSRDSIPFFAEIDGKAVATATLCIHDGVALLAGASTMPESRNQGAQQALLEARLRLAVERGCDLAIMGTEPGSASQRNAERKGFRIAYTRTKWRMKTI